MKAEEDSDDGKATGTAGMLEETEDMEDLSESLNPESNEVGDSPPEEDTVEPLDLDDFYDILSNHRRRAVIRYMDSYPDESPFSISELSEFVAAHENGKDVSDIDSAERKRAYIGLQQGHFPNLDDYGAIEFDKDRGEIDFPEGGREKRFDRLASFTKEELYPEEDKADEEYFENILGNDSYLSRVIDYLRSGF